MKKSGERMRIGVYIKSEKEYYRTGSHGYDDGVYTDYKISFSQTQQSSIKDEWIIPISAHAFNYTIA